MDSAFIVRVIVARKLPRPADAGASWPTPVCVFCLGPGDVNLLNQTHPSHGQSLVRGKAPARSLELLWWIGAHDGQPVSVQSCLKALWPDAEPEAAETGNAALPGFAYDQAVYLRGVTSAGQNLGRTPIFKGEANVESFRFSQYGYDPGRGTISWYDSYLVNVQPDAGTCFRVNNLAATPAAQVFDGIDQYIEKLPLPVLKYALNQAQLDRTCAPSVLPGVLAGPRFIIVTHPDFLAAANTLKAHKDALGINTLVVTTQTINGSGGLTATSAQIRSWLASYWDTHLVHPKWLLLMVAKVVAFENFPPANPQSGRTFTAA